MFNVVHPGKILIGPGAEWPKVSKEEKAAQKRAKKERQVGSQQQGHRAPRINVK
jgi:hypothetical protein